MTQLRSWTVVIAVMILAPASVGASILQLLSRDGVSIPDIILTISAAAAAPSLALSLLWITARLYINTDRLSIPCLVAMPSPLPRVGIIMPVYKEDPEEVAHRLGLTWSSLVATEPELAATTTVHVLSDSPPEWELRERRALERARAATGMSLYYRRRTERTNAKLGNVHEFLSSDVGKKLDLVIGLDADSVMTGEAVSRLIRILRHPVHSDVAIVQSYMFVRGATTLIGAVDGWCRQYVGRTLAIVLGRLMGGWNYFGHNYVARADLLLQASERLLACPVRSALPGLRGYVSSHDLAEGVILSEMGYRVVLDAHTVGSFEQTPPTILQYVAREARWLRGSFQHIAAGWLWRGKPAPRLVLVLCALHHANAWLGALSLALFLLLLYRGDVLLGTSAPGWNPQSETIVWSFTSMPYLLLALTIMALLLPPTLSLWWGSQRTAIDDPHLRRTSAFFLRLPTLLLVVFYGLFVGPIIAGQLAMRSIGALGLRGKWNPSSAEATTYSLGRAMLDNQPLWIAGAGVLLIAIGQPVEVRFFLVLLGTPLLCSPLTSVLVSSPRILGFLQASGLFPSPDPPIEHRHHAG